MNITVVDFFKILGIVMAAMSPVVGFVIWAIMQLLGSRKEKLMSDFKIESLTGRVNDLESEHKIFFQTRDEVTTIKEQLKHL